MEIVLASSNIGKINEINKLLQKFPVNVIAQSKFNISSVEETGLTFFENAILKARYAAEISELPALADDSGLCVDALNGSPGVFSSRYAGENATDENRINKVLNEMKNIPAEKRTASFHCVMAYMRYANDPAPIICHGIWPGIITTEARGKKGFGYDPIFYVPTHNCTAAELEQVVKNQISHRGRAFAQLEKFLNEIFLC